MKKYWKDFWSNKKNWLYLFIGTAGLSSHAPIPENASTFFEELWLLDRVANFVEVFIVLFIFRIIQDKYKEHKNISNE